MGGSTAAAASFAAGGVIGARALPVLSVITDVDDVAVGDGDGAAAAIAVSVWQ